ncbi:MAG: hypothetical protein IPO88_12115 [Nannocystis sp.]|uniref:hypothetical protein n=1 Tax=Nannocystis sp. TaxID=1962667 RepID=UPI0024221090|nr:hypothetical protein [Nannocystis sp.]MBK9754229.1 hypothetical protein [Nannocystis sp.]
MSEPAFSVLVLTEDGSPRALETIELLVKKMFRHLDPCCDNHRIRFEPGNDQAREVLTANQFKNPRHRYLRLLYGYIATQLVLPDRFVFHHVDADRRWSDRKRKPSENAAAVERDILTHVRLRLQGEKLPDAEIDRLMTRYFTLVPYWELEAWLYQNTDRALQLCRHTADCRCPELLAAWRADRSLLDDVAHPSDQLCLGKRHNDALLEGYPTADVIAANTSLAAAVNTLLACDALLRAIERTYEYLPDPGTPPA